MIALSSYEYPVLFEFGFIIFYNVQVLFYYEEDDSSFSTIASVWY